MVVIKFCFCDLKGMEVTKGYIINVPRKVPDQGIFTKIRGTFRIL